MKGHMELVQMMDAIRVLKSTIRITRRNALKDWCKTYLTESIQKIQPTLIVKTGSREVTIMVIETPF
jgi:hypothetical protein